MATSGSSDFEPDVAEYIEEAFERCGLEYRTGYDGVTARRSLNLLFADWANRGLNQWTVTNSVTTLVSQINFLILRQPPLMCWMSYFAEQKTVKSQIFK